jgi:hypothetical protein
MGRLSDWIRSPFSFLFTRSSQEERLAAYVIREHDRGRALDDVLDDPYVKNRAQPNEIARLLDRPEVIRALGESTVAEQRQKLA